MSTVIDTPDWSRIPAPVDDGAAAHLKGLRLPRLALRSTDATEIDLSRLRGRTVVYAYPRTGQPGTDNPEGWDSIPGARGCTPQSCSFRDHFAELNDLGVQNLFGLSTQSTDYQREAATRLLLPFQILSDSELKLASAVKLPTFRAGAETYLKRLTLVIDNGVVTHLFYPVFPPDQSADHVIHWLTTEAPEVA